MSRPTEVLLDGLCFGEGPRWHAGRLWFSDMHDHKVLAVDLDGKVETIADAPNQPSGLGCLPDDSLLIVSMTDRKLLRLDENGGIWVASPMSSEVLRVEEGGNVTDRISVATQAFACMLGGPEKKTLFILTANSSEPDECKQTRSGQIEMATIAIAGAGLP